MTAPLDKLVLISTPTTDKLHVAEAADILSRFGNVVHQHCPPLFSEWYHCPAVRLPSGQVIFGIDGIRKFAEQPDQFAEVGNMVGECSQRGPLVPAEQPAPCKKQSECMDTEQCEIEGRCLRQQPAPAEQAQRIAELVVEVARLSFLIRDTAANLLARHC